jgi:hypothetical protein
VSEPWRESFDKYVRDEPLVIKPHVIGWVKCSLCGHEYDPKLKHECGTSKNDD